MQGRNDTDPTLQKYGFRPGSNTSDFVSDVNFAARRTADAEQAALLRRRSATGASHQNVPVQNSQTVLDQTNITSGLGNVTWQVNQNNRITGFYSRQRYNKPNRLLNAPAITVPDSTSRRRGHVRRRPGPVELGARQEPLPRRARRRQQDSVPDLLQRRQPAVDRRQRDRHHLRQQRRARWSATATATRPTPRRSTTSIRRSAAVTNSSSASTTPTPRRPTRRRASTTSA